MRDGIPCHSDKGRSEPWRINTGRPQRTADYDVFYYVLIFAITKI